MSHYCGIDLHSNNHFVVVIDEDDKRVLEKRLDNDLSLTLETLSPFRESLHGIAVESTFNWYWLVDGLMQHGFKVKLANPARFEKYNDLKYADDKTDTFFMTEMERLNILPTGYIYPREERPVRDLIFYVPLVANCQENNRSATTYCACIFMWNQLGSEHFLPYFYLL